MTNASNRLSMPPHRQRNRDRMIQDILQTARDIMRENGVAALNMHELARRLGIKTPSLYNYFSSLMDLYDALFRSGYTLWDEYVQSYTQNADTWQEEIQLAMEAYITFAVKNPELYQLCFERPVPGFEPSEESMKVSLGSLEVWYAKFSKLKEGLNTDLSPEQITDLVIAITHGLTALHMANQPNLPFKQSRFGSLIPAALSILDKAWS